MPEEIEKPAETTLEPGEATPETPVEPVAEPAAGEVSAVEPASPEEDPAFKYWQGAYTKSRQKDAEEIRRLEERLARTEALLTPRTTPPDGPEEGPDADSPSGRVDALLRKSPTIQRMVRDLAEAKNSSLRAALEARVETAKARIPAFASDEVAFTEYLKVRPGIAAAIASGDMTLEEGYGAFAVTKPASRRATAGATRPLPRVPQKVETSSASGGVVRDIRSLVKKEGGRLSLDDVFDVAVSQAKREVKLAE